MAIVVLLTALPWCEYWLAQHNTLHETRRWRTAKTECRKGLIGGATARLTRVMLAQNHLDLSAWFGHQEAFLAEALDVASLRFSFLLDPEAQLSVMVDRGGEHFDHLSGFRLSRRSDQESMFLTTGVKRLFERAEPIRLSLADGWHVAELEFVGTTCRLSVDGVAIAEPTIDAAGRRRIGFRGGKNRALVDDVVVRHRLPDGGVGTLHEGFDRADLRPLVLPACVGIASALLLGLCLFARLLRRRGRRLLILACAIEAPIALLGWLLLALDWFWLSRLYPEQVLNIPEYPNTMFRPEVPETTWAERYPDRAAAPRTRILFVGSSQTWGSGASVAADVWTRLVEAQLNAADPTRAFECINVAESGATSGMLLPRFRDKWRAQFSPQLTVVNLGHNDPVPVDFGFNLAAFADLAREAGSRIVYVLEANCPEGGGAHLDGNHLVMRFVAEQRNVPLIEMHAFLTGASGRGFLWWDPVHLTSAGQELMAEEMTRHLLELTR